jgi:hypothetical protein
MINHDGKVYVRLKNGLIVLIGIHSIDWMLREGLIDRGKCE